jgi:hypothetical protein
VAGGSKQAPRFATCPNAGSTLLLCGEFIN